MSHDSERPPNLPTNHHTVFDLLTLPRGNYDIEEMKPIRQHASNQAWVQMQDLENWSEFTFENVYLAFGPLLVREGSKDIKRMNHSRHYWRGCAFPHTKVNIRHAFDRDSLEMAVEAARDIIRQSAIRNPGEDFYVGSSQKTTVSNPFYSTWNSKDQKGGKFTTADMCIEVPEADTGPHVQRFKKRDDDVSLLMGQIGLSGNWSFQTFSNFFRDVYHSPVCPRCPHGHQAGKPRQNMLRPTDKLATTCIWGDVRYGFLATDKELMICIVKSIPDRNPRSKRPRAGMKILNIPWRTEFVAETLTPELALCCLILAAYYNKDNTVSESYCSEDIITWHRVPKSDCSPEAQKMGNVIVYRNKWSGVERSGDELARYSHLKILETKPEILASFQWSPLV
ncbi:hypothetical protein BJ166DRAFT_597385 [Pestalotiopsis sp. NC0098]|nr:hypothetical protein BJ166DRAFT_597385 [Pestalotiopsis sp. NC0098]